MSRVIWIRSSVLQKHISSSTLGPHVFGNADNAFRKMMAALNFRKSNDDDGGGKKKKKKKSSSAGGAGAAVNTYLLEKVRLIALSTGERNYHIFYQLLEGAEDEDLEKFRLEEAEFEDFAFLSKSGTYDRRDDVDDEDTYDEMMEAFVTMGFEIEEVSDVLCVAAALLHCGNLKYEKVTGDECTIVDDEGGSFDAVLELLKVERAAFIDAICHYNVKVGKEMFKRNLKIVECVNALESLVKAVYNAIFDHLVARVNDLINSDKSKAADQAAYIGVLDIFGFESFKVNSFEQLCINYCNEALQQQFNRFVFKNEQEEYENEGIAWGDIVFPDNQDSLHHQGCHYVWLRHHGNAYNCANCSYI